MAIILVKIYPNMAIKTRYKIQIFNHPFIFGNMLKPNTESWRFFYYSFLTFGNWKPPNHFIFLVFLVFKFVFWQNFANKKMGLKGCEAAGGLRGVDLWWREFFFWGGVQGEHNIAHDFDPLGVHWVERNPRGWKIDQVWKRFTGYVKKSTSLGWKSIKLGKNLLGWMWTKYLKQKHPTR